MAGWLHVGVLVIGLGGVLGWVRLPRGRRSGAGLGLMAVSMFVLAAADLAGLALVVGPTRINTTSRRRRPAERDR